MAHFIASCCSVICFDTLILIARATRENIIVIVNGGSDMYYIYYDKIK